MLIRKPANSKGQSDIKYLLKVEYMYLHSMTELFADNMHDR